MPRTHGQPGIPFSALTAFVEAVEPLAGTDADEDADPVAMAIARHIAPRSEEHTSELQSLMRISYAVFCLKKKNIAHKINIQTYTLEHTSQNNIHPHVQQTHSTHTPPTT